MFLCNCVYVSVFVFLHLYSPPFFSLLAMISSGGEEVRIGCIKTVIDYISLQLCICKCSFVIMYLYLYFCLFILLLLLFSLLAMISGGVEVRRAVKLAKLCLTCGETETDQRNFAAPSQNLNKSKILQKSEQTEMKIL